MLILPSNIVGALGLTGMVYTVIDCECKSRLKMLCAAWIRWTVREARVRKEGWVVRVVRMQ